MAGPVIAMILSSAYVLKVIWVTLIVLVGLCCHAQAVRMYIVIMVGVVSREPASAPSTGWAITATPSGAGNALVTWTASCRAIAR